MDATEIHIRVHKLPDGRACATLINPSTPPGVGYESSHASLDRGEDQAGDAITRLRSAYDRVPMDTPIIYA